MLELKWLGHSCFKLTYEDYSIVLDPYEKNSIPGLGSLNVSANEVLCSHNHFDHGAKNEVEILKTSKDSPFKVTELHSYHDDVKGAKRGENIIHIFEVDGLKVAHLGDIGCMPTKDQMNILNNLDLVMVPIGGVYTLEPSKVRELLDIIKPNVVIPMHYRSEKFGFDEIKTVDDFIDKNDEVIYYKDNILSLEKNMKAHIAVLSL
ncbi:MAG: Zn-dependent hydrolase [Clostridium sp.]|nr:Zn-dependent hydrolase [Clostridium sp.]